MKTHKMSWKPDNIDANPQNIMESPENWKNACKIPTSSDHKICAANTTICAWYLSHHSIYFFGSISPSLNYLLSWTVPNSMLVGQIAPLHLHVMQYLAQSYCPHSTVFLRRRQTFFWNVSAIEPHSYYCRWSPTNLHQRNRNVETMFVYVPNIRQVLFEFCQVNRPSAPIAVVRSVYSIHPWLLVIYSLFSSEPRIRCSCGCETRIALGHA